MKKFILPLMGGLVLFFLAMVQTFGVEEESLDWALKPSFRCGNCAVAGAYDEHNAKIERIILANLNALAHEVLLASDTRYSMDQREKGFQYFCQLFSQGKVPNRFFVATMFKLLKKRHTQTIFGKSEFFPPEEFLKTALSFKGSGLFPPDFHYAVPIYEQVAYGLDLLEEAKAYESSTCLDFLTRELQNIQREPGMVASTPGSLLHVPKNKLRKIVRDLLIAFLQAQESSSLASSTMFFPALDCYVHRLVCQLIIEGSGFQNIGSFPRTIYNEKEPHVYGFAEALAFYEDQDIIEKLLSYEFIFLSKDLFHLVTVYGSKESLAHLIKMGHNFDGRGKDGRTPIMTGIWGGNFQNVLFLLSLGADVHTKDNRGQTPLHECLCYHSRRFGLVESLLEKGASSNERNFEGKTPLHLAAAAQDENMVRLLLEKGKANPNIPDNLGNTPVFLAISHGDKPEAVRVLLKSGAKVDIFNSAGESPIHLAAKGYYPKALETILSEGGDVNLKNQKGCLPLDVASKECVSVLIKHGAPWNALGAVQAENAVILEELGRQNPALLNVRDDSGGTALHRLANQPNSQLLDILVKYGADINIKNNQGETAFHLACFYDRPDQVRKMLLLKPDLYLMNNRGLTPLAIAETTPNGKGCVPILREAINLLK